MRFFTLELHNKIGVAMGSYTRSIEITNMISVIKRAKVN
ncbi:Uncharacterised protein [uncultured archaeon]|nr:Uncharacterised protein [uncultured archaeon]